jgi:hypothetical protein
VFNYANRLLEMGQIICDPWNYVLFGILELGGPPALMVNGYIDAVGNVVGTLYDRRAECCVWDITPRSTARVGMG